MNITKILLWPPGAHSPWEPPGGCVKPASALPHLRGKEAGIYWSLDAAVTEDHQLGGFNDGNYLSSGGQESKIKVLRGLFRLRLRGVYWHSVAPWFLLRHPDLCLHLHVTFFPCVSLHPQFLFYKDTVVLD